MKNNDTSAMLVISGGALIGLIFGCLITWYPIRLLFCASYNTPECEEIVLMVFPLYCFITPFIGILTAYFIYSRRHQSKAECDGSVLQDGAAGEDDGDAGQNIGT